jgi:hypothetical protein
METGRLCLPAEAAPSSRPQTTGGCKLHTASQQACQVSPSDPGFNGALWQQERPRMHAAVLVGMACTSDAKAQQVHKQDHIVRIWAHKWQQPAS